MTHLASAVVVLALVIVLLPSTGMALTSAPGPQPFGHACTLESYGVRFCPTASLGDRVPSFDGALLDADVTLPATGSGPWPTIVMIPPSASSKTVYETPDP